MRHGLGQHGRISQKYNFPSMAKLKKILEDAPAAAWAGFQVYYPMPEKEVRSSSGVDLIESMMAIFEEVTPAMNLCMQIQLDDNRLREKSDVEKWKEIAMKREVSKSPK